MNKEEAVLNKDEAVCEILRTVIEVGVDIPEVVMGALQGNSILTEWEAVVKDMIQEVGDLLEDHLDFPTIVMKRDTVVAIDVVGAGMRDKKKDMNHRKTVMVTDTQVNKDQKEDQRDQREDQEQIGMRKSMKNQERDDPHSVQEVEMETLEVVTVEEDTVAEVIMVEDLSIVEVEVIVEAVIVEDSVEEEVIEEATVVVVVVVIVMEAEVNVLHVKKTEIGMVPVKEEV